MMSRHTAVRHWKTRIRLLTGTTLAGVLGFAMPLRAQPLDLSCSPPYVQADDSIVVYHKALNGHPLGITTKIEAGQQYEIACGYTVSITPLGWLKPWKIRIQADGEALTVTGGAQKPAFGHAGMGAWRGRVVAAWTPKPGSGHSILCLLDVANALPESNESNNACTRSFGTPSTSARPPSPGEIAVQPRVPGSGVVLPKRATASRGTGERVTLNPQPEPPSSGAAKRQADTNAAAPRGGPNLSAAKLTTTAAVVQPAQPSAGQKLKVIVTVRNEGGLPSQRGSGVLLACREVPGQPQCPKMLSASTTLPSLGAGQSYQASISPAVAWPAGRYEIVVGTDVIFMNDARTIELVVKP